MGIENFLKSKESHLIYAGLTALAGTGFLYLGLTHPETKETMSYYGLTGINYLCTAIGTLNYIKRR